MIKYIRMHTKNRLNVRKWRTSNKMMLVNFIFNVWEDEIVHTLSWVAWRQVAWVWRWRDGEGSVVQTSCGEIVYIELYRLRRPSHVRRMWSPFDLRLLDISVLYTLKVYHTPEELLEFSSPLCKLWARRWINHWSLWRMASATLDLRLPSQLQDISAPRLVANYADW